MSSININNKIIIPCESGDSILRSSLRNSIGIAYECNSGGCGACKVDLISGEVQNKYPDASSLTKRDVRKNRILACQNVPVGSIEINAEISGGSESYILPVKYNAKLISKEIISSDVVEFSFAIKSDVKYRPGQYFMLSICGLAERAYSVSSPDSEDGVIKFIIKKMDMGKVSSYLFDEINSGDVIGLDGPYGHAYLIENNCDVVCIAGGAGLSPIASIIRSLKKNGSTNKLHFFYGINFIEDLNIEYISRLIGDMSGSEYNFIPAITNDNENWSGEIGFIHQVVERCLPDFLNKEFYFCGPPVMTSAVQKMLMIEKSVPFERMHFDRFF